MRTSAEAEADMRLESLTMQRHEYWCAQRMEGPPIIFCCRCGAFARLEGHDRAKGLKERCKGALPRPAAASAGEKKKRQYLGRLLRGLDPYTGKALG